MNGRSSILALIFYNIFNQMSVLSFQVFYLSDYEYLSYNREKIGENGENGEVLCWVYALLTLMWANNWLSSTSVVGANG